MIDRRALIDTAPDEPTVLSQKFATNTASRHITVYTETNTGRGREP
jgi:hypothetical protein